MHVEFGSRELNSQLPFSIRKGFAFYASSRGEGFRFAIGFAANSDRNEFSSDRSDLKSPETKHQA